jgi:hypothetical protein
MRADICQAERDQRLAWLAPRKLRDTRPRRSVERRKGCSIAISVGKEEDQDESSRRAGWVSLALKPELVQLSEEGERKLADERMDRWAGAQTEHEEKQRALIDQRKEQSKREEEVRLAKQMADDEAKRTRQAEEKEERKKRGQLTKLEAEYRRRIEEEKAMRAQLSKEEARAERRGEKPNP